MSSDIQYDENAVDTHLSTFILAGVIPSDIAQSGMLVFTHKLYIQAGRSFITGLDFFFMSSRTGNKKPAARTYPASSLDGFFLADGFLANTLVRPQTGMTFHQGRKDAISGHGATHVRDRPPGKLPEYFRDLCRHQALGPQRWTKPLDESMSRFFYGIPLTKVINGKGVARRKPVDEDRSLHRWQSLLTRRNDREAFEQVLQDCSSYPHKAQYQKRK